MCDHSYPINIVQNQYNWLYAKNIKNGSKLDTKMKQAIRHSGACQNPVKTIAYRHAGIHQHDGKLP